MTCFTTELLEDRPNLQWARSGKTECYSVSMVVCSLLDKEKGMLGPLHLAECDPARELATV